MTLRLLNWNIEWARPGTNRGKAIRQIIDEQHADIVCITESHEDLFDSGHTICSGEDYGYPIKPGRRKVILWSKTAWRDVDAVGDPGLPTGRFIAATTATVIGDIRFIGVCIPWSSAHVSSGSKDRTRWQDHHAYLDGLKRILANQSELPLIVLGDFNQTIPRTRAPKAVYEKLQQTIQGLTVATSGLTDSPGHNAIDHICHTPDLHCTISTTLDKQTDSIRLSDHFGVCVEVAENCRKLKRAKTKHGI